MRNQTDNSLCLTKIYYALLFFCVVFHVQQAQAKSTDFNLSVSGFGTVGVATSDSDTLGFHRNALQASSASKGRLEYLTDSSLGLQFTGTTSRVSGVVQFLALDRVNNDVNHAIHYAFLGVKLTDNLKVKIGRNPLDIFLLSDYRHVGYAYTWSRPVPEYYSGLFADNYEGGKLNLTIPLHSGTLNLMAYTGVMEGTIPLKGADNFEFEYSPLLGGKITFETDTFQLSGAYLYGAMNGTSSFVNNSLVGWQHLSTSGFPEANAIRELFTLKDEPAHYYCLAGSWEKAGLIFQGEAGILQYPEVLDLSYTTGYLSLAYQLQKWTPFIVLATLHTTMDELPLSAAKVAALPPESQTLAAQTKMIFEGLAGDQNTLSLGARYELTRTTALKLQWNHHQIEAGKTVLWEKLNNTPHTEKTVNTWSISLDFIF